MNNKRFTNKAVKLKEKLRQLQWELYDFQLQMQQHGINEEVAQLASDSAFELDVSQMKMEHLIIDLQN